MTIFVTVGTTDFDALVEQMDELAPGLDEQVVCQVGNGVYTPRHCQHFRFAPNLADHILPARLVVSHGGLGCITDVARLGKPLVGVSNPDRRDHHQDEFLRKFATNGHLIWCHSLDELRDALERAASTTFAPYAEPSCRIHSVIEEFLFARRMSQIR
jgi:UDP-N-acetylglucosamine transferase subunit ALG13